MAKYPQRRRIRVPFKGTKTDVNLIHGDNPSVFQRLGPRVRDRNHVSPKRSVQASPPKKLRSVVTFRDGPRFRRALAAASTLKPPTPRPTHYPRGSPVDSEESDFPFQVRMRESEPRARCKPAEAA